jgi:hypothetical protein
MIEITQKLCPKCKEVKPRSEWYRNKAKPDGLGSWCKVCQKVLLDLWYTKPGNAKKQKDNAMARRDYNKTRLMDYFGNCCFDCKQSYDHVVYDFHHLDPAAKEYGWGVISSCSWALVEREIIGKCVMLCSNCRRIRHHGGS